MEDVIYIFGHKKPDTDSICAAIAYADLKRKLGYNAVACRLGEINEETRFILDYFDVPVPKYLNNVKTQVSDLEIDLVDNLSYDISIKIAWSKMQETRIKSYPVVDENEKLIGIVSLSNITGKYMDAHDFNSLAACNTKIDNILETIGGVIVGGKREYYNAPGKIVIAANSPDGYGDYIESGDIVITGNRVDSQKEALRLGANTLILTCGSMPCEEIQRIAEEKKAVVIKTLYDTFTTARLINQSIPVGSIMTGDKGDAIVKFHIDDYVDDVRERMLKHRHSSYPVVDSEGHVVGLISRYHLISQKKKRVILLDHNEKSQTVNGIEEAEILEIIDHHKLGDLTTARPILFMNEPVGSTSTIIANLFVKNGKRPSSKIAGILCAAIVSDTLKFQSSTSTVRDYQTAQKLASIAGIDIDEFATEMFKAGTAVGVKTPEEIFNQDFKRYTLHGYEIGVGQVTVYEHEKILKIKSELIDYMNKKAENDDYALLVMMITDLNNKTTELQLSGRIAESVAEELGIDTDAKNVIYSSIMSRKKDVIPLIASAIEKMEL